MSSIGMEEGCPREAPKDLDEIIARPVERPGSAKIPIARPIPIKTSTESVPVVAPCEAEEQTKFGACVQPLTAFQPHPLAVIKQPKQIDDACEAYRNFNHCRTQLKCNPLWARGMRRVYLRVFTSILNFVIL